MVYVDDIIIASKSSSVIDTIKSKLQQLFKLKVIGDLRYFLGLEIAQSKKDMFFIL